MTHQATHDFLALYYSYLKTKGNTRRAYELAEADWIKMHGRTKFKNRKQFYTRLSRIKKNIIEPKQSTKEIQLLRFMEIYNFVSDPYKYARDNYEVAESEYMKEYGSRRFSSFDHFCTARSRYRLKQKSK